MSERTYRAGDDVRHLPSGETWTLACDQDGEHVMPAGWPESRAFASDCVLLRAASDEERLQMLHGASNPCKPGSGMSFRRSLAARQLKADK